MNLERQIQELIDGAPQDGKTPSLIKAIAPALKQIAERLGHPQYYVLQSLEQRWLVTTLSSRAQPQVEKNVVYAFANHQDAAAGSKAQQDSRMIALPVSIIQLLFQILALDSVDSMIFFDTPGNIEMGVEIQRQEIQNLIQAQLQQIRRNQDSNIPPDIA